MENVLLLGFLLRTRSRKRMYFHFDCFYFRVARARQSDVVQMWQINSTIGNSSVLSVSGVRLRGGAVWKGGGGRKASWPVVYFSYGFAFGFASNASVRSLFAGTSGRQPQIRYPDWQMEIISLGSFAWASSRVHLKVN